MGSEGHGDRVDTVFYPRLGVKGCLSAGANRGRHPGKDDMSARKQSVLSEHKPLLRPVIGLAENLTKEDLEAITIEAIRRHRRLRDEAEALHAPYVENPPSTGDTVGPPRLAWVSAMIHMHAQQALLSSLLDVLGYIPNVQDERKAQRSKI